MKLADTFAVVDLETTGTSFDGNNRIIQFSCVFVKNNKIINDFNTLINPEMRIPPEIEELTGISNKDVKGAPYFDDVAGTIYSLLQGTTFVAHNIQFDYRFLSREFERVGYPELDLPGIDTVQLAQILFPTSPSYRLTELGRQLGIENKHPHNADSDAQVTARLLIKLRNKLARLPLPLLADLAPLSSALLYDTGELFRNAYRNKKRKKKILSKDFVNVNGLLLQRIEHNVDTPDDAEYPKSNQEKKKLFAGRIELRNEQARMMNSIHNLWNKKDRAMKVIQAPTGMGKTFGYLFPTFYAVAKGQKFVISTSTMALQDQLYKKDLPKIGGIYGIRPQILSLKGSSNYIDIAKFVASLSEEQNDATRLLQMKILVWLSRTKTGAFAELHLTKLQDSLFNEIAHRGLGSLDPKSPYYDYDFVKRQQDALKNTDIVITNHSYLLNHVSEMADFADNLVLDEGQDLSALVVSNNKQEMDLDEVKIIADTLLTRMESKVSYSFKEIVDDKFITGSQYKELLQAVQIVDHSVPRLRSLLMKRFLSDAVKNDEYTQVLLDDKKLLGFCKENLSLIRKVNRARKKLQEIKNYLERKLNQGRKSGRLGRDSIDLLSDVLVYLEQLSDCLELWDRFLPENIAEIAKERLLWLTISSQADNAHLRLQVGILDGKGYLKSHLYEHFEKCLLLGASLFIPQLKTYMFRQLDLDPKVKVESYQGPFDYKKQALAVVAQDAPIVNQVERDEYISYLADAIEEICSRPVQTMVLFNSLADIEDTYRLLAEHGFTQKREVLAQGVNGSAEKLRKRFILGKQKDNILLGTGAFWEGIDLPHDQLKLLIVTRLPFQSPSNDYNRVRLQNISRNGGDPFKEITLPEAILRLKQGWGRLIRTPDDAGAFVMLDGRFIKKNYGKQFRTAFPKQLAIHEMKTKNIGPKIDGFL